MRQREGNIKNSTATFGFHQNFGGVEVLVRVKLYSENVWGSFQSEVASKKAKTSSPEENLVFVMVSSLSGACAYTNMRSLTLLGVLVEAPNVQRARIQKLGLHFNLGGAGLRRLQLHLLSG